MPASNKILSYLWQFYVINYAHTAIKDHVLNVVQGCFLELPWDRFNPSVDDVELMVKVIDQYLPDCHLFLANVFFKVNWPQWIADLIILQPLPVVGRMHGCLLNLLVKLSNEPNVRSNDRTQRLVQEAEKFSWHLVDAASFDQVINWHVMSCDPRVVMVVTGEQSHPLDLAIHRYI